MLLFLKRFVSPVLLNANNFQRDILDSDGTLTATTVPGQSGSGSHGKERVLTLPRAGASLSDEF